jgi:hypothetical protein
MLGQCIHSVLRKLSAVFTLLQKVHDLLH